MKSGQSVTVQAVPKKSPDEQDGVLVAGDVPVWTSVDPSIVTVTPAADGMSAVVARLDGNGSVQVDVKAHLLAFGPLFTSSFLVTKTPDPADHFTFVFGTPAP